MKLWHSNPLFLLTLFVFLASASLIADAEEDINGVWKGAILSKQNTSEYNLFLIFTGSSQRPSGVSQYLDYGCEGELKLKSYKRGTYTFVETINEGADNCATGSTIEISVRNDGELSYKWFYPNGELGLLTDLVESSAADAATIANANELPDQTSPASNIASELTEPEKKARALSYLEDVAAHPEDPQNPPGVEGVTDEEIAAMPFEDVQELFEETLEYAEEEINQPRYLFALGRAAYLHEDEEYAQELLERAASRGSAAAGAYLAMLMDDTDLDGMANQLRKAVAGGFEPAEPWLKEIETMIAELAEEEAAAKAAAFDLNKFKRPDLMRAFYTGDLSSITETELATMAYVGAVLEFLTGSEVIYYVDDMASFAVDLDPNLLLVHERKLVGSSQAIGDALGAGKKMAIDFFSAIAETRKKGGTIQEEVQNSMLAIMNNPTNLALGTVRNQANLDAKILVSYYDKNREAFRKVYSGIRKYVYAQ